MNSFFNLTSNSFDKKEKKPLIKNLSFKVKKGEILFISGKSGLGKSTLLDLISGFHDDNLIWTGKIYLNKHDITNSSIQNKKIGYMLQDYFLFPHFKASLTITRIFLPPCANYFQYFIFGHF